MTRPNVSVILPTYNERENIQLLVKGIKRALNHRNYEVVVVDDNSPDGTAQVARYLSKSNNSTSKQPKKLSIVIPARNEGNRLKATLTDYYNFFRQKLGEDFEIIVVCNGCEDNSTEIAAEFGIASTQVKLLNLEGKGKGFAIIEGFKVANGALIGFIDADNATSPPNFWKLVVELSSREIDGVTGSRNLPGSVIPVRQPLNKRVASRGFHWLVSVLFGLHFKDTQCGAKLFKSYLVRYLISKVHTRGFAFDVDLLWRATKGGYNIVEIPLVWQSKAGSTFSLSKEIPRMLLAILRLRLLGDK